MPVINVRGKPAGKAKAKPAARKPARAAARQAPKPRARAAKSTNGRKAPERVNRSSKMPDIPKAELNRILGPLKKSADKREKHYADWKSEVAAVNEMIVEALDAEIPVKEIVDNAQVSRQHVYKIIADMQEGKRGTNGVAKGVAGRPPVQKTRRSAGSKRITRSTNGRKAPAKAKPKVGTSTGRPRIRARA